MIRMGDESGHQTLVRYAHSRLEPDEFGKTEKF